MVEMKNRLENIKMSVNDMHLYHRLAFSNNHTIIKLGKAITGIEEKHCENKLCRVICPNKTIDNATVITQDGFVWNVWLFNFDSWQLIEKA